MSSSQFTIDRTGLDALITVLAARGFRVEGPTVRNGVIRCSDIRSTADLPQGRRDHQAPGEYRLTPGGGSGLFGFAVGPDSLRQPLFPPRRLVWTAAHGPDGTLRFEASDRDPQPVAVIGARSCDLAAMGVQDRVLMDGAHADHDYAARRARVFLVAVDCTRPAATCFCSSMATGPAAPAGFDLALTELDGCFVGRVGTESGASVVESIPHRTATREEIDDARQRVESAANSMQRSLDTTDVHDLLAESPTARTWEDVAEACLACGNCTQACPTCFCTTTEDAVSLDGDVAQRTRRWDSCFSLDFSSMGGHPVRHTVGARYRQWLTHKLSGWIDQFGTFGCVGCGRCITWCPVAIDLTAVVPALRAEAAGA